MSSEYNSWRSMIGRCTRTKNNRYERYGGRGIKVCDRWLESFPDFLTDMGPKPTPNHSIDRYPDPDGDYEPGNCRWATREEQEANKRRPPNGV